MAKSKDTAVVDVIINNEAARKRVQELTDEFEMLRKRKIAALQEGNNILADSIGKEMGAIRKELRQYQKQVIDVDHVLRNLNKVPLNQLQAAQRVLRTNLQHLDRDSKEYLDTIEKIEKVEREIQSTRSSGGAPGWLKNLGVFAGGAALVAKLSGTASQAIEIFASLDDKMADVMKTTGMTKEEVKALDAELRKIDTRTSREDLLDLARVAGKLGIAKEDVAGFVRAADQIKVALAEDLGGNAEAAIQSIGKLVDIFHLKDGMELEQAMLATGSAINSLGAASTANEGNIVEFTNRMAGIAPKANISIQSVLGLGATLDALAQPAQVASTAVSQAITGMARNTEKYAKIAGMSLGEFKKLFEEDANEALIRFLEGLNKGGGGMIEMTAKLDSLKLKGKQSTQVLGALAGNVEMLREQQAISNEEFAKGTSITEEYNTKNNSAQAILEKRRKLMTEALADLGERLMPLWSSAIGMTGNFTKALVELFGWLYKYRGVILSIGGALLAHAALQKAKIALQKLEVFWSAAHRAEMVKEILTLRGATASTQLLAAAKLLLAGSVRAAGVAFKMFWASIGPIGWIVTAIAAVASILSVVSAKADTFAKSAQDLTDVNKKANDTYVEEKMRLEELLKVASDKAESDKNRKKATEELQRILPNGIALINEETIANGKAQKAVDDYCKSLLLRAKIEAGKEKLVELEKERLNALEDGSAVEMTTWQKTGFFIKQSLGFQQAAFNQLARNTADNLAVFEAEYAKRGENIANMVKEWEQEARSGLSLGTDDDDDNGGGGGFGGDDEKGKWRLEKDAAFMEKKIALRKKLYAGEIATEEEHNRQLLALEIEALERRIKQNVDKEADLNKLKSELADKRYDQAKAEKTRIEKLLAASLEGTTEGESGKRYQKEQADYEKRLRDLGLFGRDRELLTKQELAALENLERNHTKALQHIYTDRLIKEFEDKQKEVKRQMAQIRIAQNEEFQAADSFAKKKALLHKHLGKEEADRVRTEREATKKLRDFYNKAEQDEAKKQIEAMIADYKKVMEGLNAVSDQGLTLGQLNPEEVERIQAIIDNLNEQLAALRGTGPETGQSDLQKVDILGFTSDDWEKFFTNLESGELGLKGWQMALGLVSEAFGTISKLMTAVEQREFKEYEKTAKKKKATLDKQLKDGLISQDNYNAQVQEIDDETDRKRDEMERKQAVREKAMSVFQAMVNTAVAVTAALSVQPAPLGIALAAFVGSLGAAQIGAILATPLPGAEDGGSLMDVLRTQDGKSYRAKYDPKRRGYVDRTSVLVSEDGREYVIPTEGTENPTIRPILDIIEVARRNNTLGSINLPAILEATGRAAGGYVRSAPESSSAVSAVAYTNGEIDYERLCLLLDNNREVLQQLAVIFSRPIPATLSWFGENGFLETQKRYESFQKNTNIGGK